MDNQMLVDVVDAADQVIAQLPKAEVEQKRLLHRVAGVILANSKGELLIHRRSMATDQPGKYSLFVCQTVKAGDTFVPTAADILRNKLRIIRGKETVNIQPLFPFNFRSADANINFGIFTCTVNGPLEPNPLFIGEHFFAPVLEVERLLKEKPFLESSQVIFQQYQEAQTQ